MSFKRKDPKSHRKEERGSPQTAAVKMNVLEAAGDLEGEGSDDLTGRKKSRLKSIKSRLFGKIRRKEDGGGMKQSQSESDITWGAEDSDCSKGMMGSRAFSHDSIFQAEHSHSDPEPLRILSQENIHGKIRSLQIKLQQQKMHLGPPPQLLPKRHEDLGGNSEDDGLPRSPTEGLDISISNKFSITPKNHSTLSLAGTGSEEEEQSPSQPLSPRPVSPAPLSPLAPGSVVDFSTPPQVTSLLDNSAARHRMSLKPKNQRASAKRAGSRTRSESMNNLDRSVVTREDEERQALIKEIPRARSYSSQVLHPGEKLTVTQIKSLPVSPLMSLQTDREDGTQVSTEPDLERNILSASPPSLTLKEVPPAESPVPKPPIPVVPTDRKGKGEVSETLINSKLLKNGQSNLVSSVSHTVRSNVATTPEMSLVKDGKSSNTVLIQNKMDTFSKYSVESAVNIENRQPFTPASSSVICGVNLRPSSLRRNVPSAEDKHESKTLHPVSTELAVSQEVNQTEIIKRQRTVSGSLYFNVSSDKNQERPRTASFTGVFGQTGLKKEATEPTKPSLHYKIDQQVSLQVEKTKDPCTPLKPLSQKEEKNDSDTVIPTKFIELSKALDVKELQDNKKKEIRVKATEEQVHEVEVAEEAGEGVMKDETVEKEKETTNAFGVKLRSTSLSLKFRMDKAQSEDKKKRHSFEITQQALSLVAQSDSTSCVEPEDQRSVHAKLKDTPVQTSASVLTSGSPPKLFCSDKERSGFLRQTELPQTSSPLILPSKDTKIVPSPPKEGIDLPPEETSSQQNVPTSASSEVSWMEMAREKTRTLQQLFTSRLPEFPSLQSRSTTSNTTQTQTSTSQANPKTAQNITNQPTAEQPNFRPTETKHLPSPQPSGRSTQSTTQMQTQTKTSQPSANSTPSQSDSSKEVQVQSRTATKQYQPPVTCASNVHTSKPPSQTWAPQAPPVLHSSPMRAASQTPTQAILRPTPPPHLLSSPKLTSHLVSQQSASTVLKDQPQDDGGEPTLISGRSDRASVLQGRGTGPEDDRPVWAAGLGNKTSLVQRWESQTSATAKASEQKATSQSTVPLRPVSTVSALSTGLDPSLSTQTSVLSGPMKSADREDKSSSPSSSPLQSVRDSSQPSWMELAKRKSLAWSDKTMD